MHDNHDTQNKNEINLMKDHYVQIYCNEDCSFCWNIDLNLTEFKSKHEWETIENKCN